MQKRCLAERNPRVKRYTFTKKESRLTHDIRVKQQPYVAVAAAAAASTTSRHLFAARVGESATGQIKINRQRALKPDAAAAAAR